jgi:hypothetical protein
MLFSGMVCLEEAMDTCGNTPLHKPWLNFYEPVSGPHLDALEKLNMLLDYGANVRAHNRHGSSVLHCFLFSEWLNLAMGGDQGFFGKLLTRFIEGGAAIDAKNGWGETVAETAYRLRVWFEWDSVLKRCGKKTPDISSYTHLQDFGERPRCRKCHQELGPWE